MHYCIKQFYKQLHISNVNKLARSKRKCSIVKSVSNPPISSISTSHWFFNFNFWSRFQIAIGIISANSDSPRP